MIFFKKKPIALGEGKIIQYTIFESKRFGGVWIYNWKTIKQNRFHSHAFKMWAYLLWGSYREEVIKNGEIYINNVNQWMKRRVLPKSYTHRILDAKPNTWTIAFFGKWDKHWWEYFHDSKTWVKYGWGRKVLEKKKGNERDKLQ